MVLEYIKNGNLFQFCKDNQEFMKEEKRVLQLFGGVCEGVYYLHSQGVLHRDIKSENILVDALFEPKICDFGWAASLENNRNRSTFCGTFDYMAPEILESKKYSFPADIWSLGVLLFELFHGEPSFKSKNSMEIINKINKKQITFSAQINSKIKDLINWMLEITPENRPTSLQVCKVLTEEFEIEVSSNVICEFSKLTNLNKNQLEDFKKSNIEDSIQKPKMSKESEKMNEKQQQIRFINLMMDGMRHSKNRQPINSIKMAAPLIKQKSSIYLNSETEQKNSSPLNDKKSKDYLCFVTIPQQNKIRTSLFCPKQRTNVRLKSIIIPRESKKKHASYSNDDNSKNVSKLKMKANEKEITKLFPANKNKTNDCLNYILFLNKKKLKTSFSENKKISKAQLNSIFMNHEIKGTKHPKNLILKNESSKQIKNDQFCKNQHENSFFKNFKQPKKFCNDVLKFNESKIVKKSLNFLKSKIQYNLKINEEIKNMKPNKSKSQNPEDERKNSKSQQKKDNLSQKSRQTKIKSDIKICSNNIIKQLFAVKKENRQTLKNKDTPKNHFKSIFESKKPFSRGYNLKTELNILS